MKKYICLILLFTLSSSGVLAQFADQMNNKIQVMNETRIDLHQSHFIFLGEDKKVNFLASDSLSIKSYSIWYPWDGETIFIQTLAGAFGLVVGGVFGFLPVTMCHGNCLPLVIGIPIGSVLGLSFAVDMSGDGQGGSGSFGLTLLGAIIGAMCIYGLITLVHPKYIYDSGYIYLLPVMSIAGAITGYHLSANPVITTNRTSLIQFEKNQFALNVPIMKLNRYEYPATSYGISANVLSIHF